MLRFFPDDAFYYLQTSFNFTSSGFISFDGINATNGFHPLYFLIVSFFTWILGKTFLLQTIFILNTVLVFTSLLIIIHFFHADLSPTYRTILLSLFTLPNYVLLTFWYSAGMEASIVFFSTILLFIVWNKANENLFQTYEWNMMLGIAITLFMLSRLDLIIVVPVLIIYLFCFSKIKLTSLSNLKYIVSIIGVPFIFGSIYIGLNAIYTGHVIPVSGIVKQLYFIPFETSWRESTGGGIKGFIFGTFPLAMCLITSGLLWIQSRRGVPIKFSAVTVLINIGVLIYYCHLYFYASNFFYWYFAFPFATAAINMMIILSFFVKAVPKKSSALTKIGFPALSITLIIVNLIWNFTFLFDVNARSESVSFHLKQISDRMDTFINPKAVIGTFDAGTIGYFSKGTVINLDGLANNFDYLFNFKKKRRFLEYFKEKGITYFLVRDLSIANHDAVKTGNYTHAVFGLDTKIALDKKNELFRYSIPNAFSVYFFKLYAI